MIGDYGVLLGRLGVVEADLQPPLLDTLEPLFSVYTRHVRVQLYRFPVIFVILYAESDGRVGHANYRNRQRQSP